MQRQPHKFLPGARVVEEETCEGAGGRDAVLLFNAAHLHAEVAGLDDDGDAFRLQGLLNAVTDLLGEALLDLQAAGEGVDDPRNLAEANNGAVGDVRDMSLAKKRKHVVLTQAVHLDVLDQDHFVIGLVKQRGAQDFRGIHTHAARQHGHGFGCAHRRLQQTLALGILPQMVRTFSYASAIAFTAASS